MIVLYDTPGYLARKINPAQYIVINHDTGKQYKVDHEKATCTCPHHTFRKAWCKHIQGIEDELWWDQEEAA